MFCDNSEVDIEDDSLCQRLRDWEAKRVLFWTRRLCLSPDEVRRLTPHELECRLSLLEHAEQAEQSRLDDFRRWQSLCELRYLMYTVQREFNEKHGQAAVGVSIWRILSLEQHQLERKLHLEDLRGGLQRFPSPMSVMVPECETADVLKPLIPLLTGFSKQVSKEKVEKSTATDVLYDRGNYHEANSEEQPQTEEFQVSSREQEQSSITCDLNMQEDLDIELELQQIKRSTERWDYIMETLFAPSPCPKQSLSETDASNKLHSMSEQWNFHKVPFVHNLTMKTQCDLDSVGSHTYDCQCGRSHRS